MNISQLSPNMQQLSQYGRVEVPHGYVMEPTAENASSSNASSSSSSSSSGMQVTGSAVPVSQRVNYFGGGTPPRAPAPGGLFSPRLPAYGKGGNDPNPDDGAEAPRRPRPGQRQARVLFTPTGFYLPFGIPLHNEDGTIRIEVGGKKKQDFIQYIPATKSSRANMKFKLWFNKYSLYATGEIQAGESRGALARELVLKSVGEMESTFHRWDRNLINFDGSCGDPANGFPP